MKLKTALTIEGCAARFACVSVVLAFGCADGPAYPTSPTASAVTTDAGRSADGQGTAVTTARPSQLLIQKTCDAADHCTVVNSISGPLPAGTEVFYTGPLLTDRTTSGVRVVLPDEQGTATGHCSVSYRTGTGTCVLTGGSGLLAGIHANLTVTSLFNDLYPGGLYTWDGGFRYAPAQVD